MSVNVPPDFAAWILCGIDCEFIHYSRILGELLASGYDINSGNGKLLRTALTFESPCKVALLFEKGAGVADNDTLYSDPQYGNVYSRVYKNVNITKMLFTHTLSSSRFPVIQQHFSAFPHHLDMFKCLEQLCPSDLVTLYIRLNQLPNSPSKEILAKCAARGLRSNAELKDDNDALCKTNKELCTINKELCDKLEKANKIIARLTDL